jgi:DNA-nicking Smr family endonuclease
MKDMQSHIKKLDLHGVKHAEAAQVCHDFINFSWGNYTVLHIITGHSQAMKAIVEKVLKNYDVDYTIGDLRNSGYIKILL